MKAKSSASFIVSIALHLIVCVIGFFYWFSVNPSQHADSIDTFFTSVEEPKNKRITPTKRPQIQRETTQSTSQAKMKILTSNAPPTQRGAVSAAEPSDFQTFEKVDLNAGIDAAPTTIEFQGVPRIQRGAVEPVMKQKKTTERFKSKLVKFIEAQEGPQNIVYCIDLSKSMQVLQERKLKRILDLMQDSLTFLEPHDQFNIMAYSTQLVPYNKDFVTVSERSVAEASSYISNIKTQVNTKGQDYDMLTALTEISKSSPTLVVLFSDGIPTSISTPDLDFIGQHAKGNGRIFGMGMGMAPDYPGAVMLKKLTTVSDGDLWLVDR
ncbi:VWA domain-containing protein [Candidatus Poribacteria bacterium]|nr:VWA domain-containing protein [Candidatus Poribacteria bacterium]